MNRPDRVTPAIELARQWLATRPHSPADVTSLAMWIESDRAEVRREALDYLAEKILGPTRLAGVPKCGRRAMSDPSGHQYDMSDVEAAHRGRHAVATTSERERMMECREIAREWCWKKLPSFPGEYAQPNEIIDSLADLLWRAALPQRPDMESNLRPSEPRGSEGRDDDMNKQRAIKLIQGVRDHLIEAGYHHPNEELDDLEQALLDLGCTQSEARGDHD